VDPPRGAGPFYLLFAGVILNALAFFINRYRSRLTHVFAAIPAIILKTFDIKHIPPF
jgi:hypothetical protein